MIAFPRSAATLALYDLLDRLAAEYPQDKRGPASLPPGRKEAHMNRPARPYHGGARRG